MNLTSDHHPEPSVEETTPIGRLILDNKRRVVEADGAFCRLFSIDATQVIGKDMDDICTARDRQGVDRYLTAIATYQNTPIDLILSLSLGGKERFCRLRMVRTSIGWAAYLEPIGATKNDRLHDLTTWAEHWRTIVASSSDGIALLDTEGKIVEHNQAFMEIMKFKSEHEVALSDESIRGRRFFELQQDSAFIPVSTAFAETKPRARRFSGTIRYRGKRLEVELSPTISSSSGFLGASLVLQDSTAAEQLDSLKMRAFRDAGRSEVATNVLHNVGNVLNSLNVSASAMEGHIRKQRIDGVQKVQLLLAEQIEPLSTALGDERSSRLISFLDALSSQLAEEQKAALSEAARLRENIEHIKVIVAAQQSLTGKGIAEELLRVQDLIEAAIQVSGILVLHRNISMVKDFMDIPPTLIDRHRTAQILINLLSNARNAVLESVQTDKQIRVSLRKTREGIQISVYDNGVGIEPENMAKIFQHGFSTRKSGHGFGLHSCANLSREMAGSLTVTSNGTNMGTTFTLDIPFKPATPSNHSEVPA